ncbi:MAG: peptidylprolyl isomerase [Nanoarchaeota archaeon]|nr:peptidylprolyl isomerase [Nanoarchaeota archaeon]
MPKKVKKTVANKDISSKRKPRKMKKKTIKKISAVVVLIVILAVAFYFAFKTLTPQKAIATVNGEAITSEELNIKYDQLPDQYKLFVTKEDFLEQMINVKLLLQEAKEQEVVVNEDQIEEELDNLRKQVATDEEFEQLLAEGGTTLDELKQQIKEQLTINKLLDDVVLSNIDISESRIESYYEENKAEFEAKAGEIRLRHILVGTEEEAKELLDDLKKGADFADIAALNSIDTASAANGGDLGFAGKGKLVKEFEDAAFMLKVGEMSGLVETQFGFHIIKREVDMISYDDAKEGIRQVLAKDISNNAIEIYINQLKVDSTIITKEGESTKEAKPLIEEEIIIEEQKEIETFTETEDSVCKEDGKVIIRMYSTTTNAASKWVSETFDSLVEEYAQDITSYNWKLDERITKEELNLFQKFNVKSTVPTYVFGCKYVRTGNAYETLEEEKAEFMRVIEKLIDQNE